ncbi:hypothetical protein [Accumulibacter sp.]|uniref:hypothetical protein n=1 Tax=Accumulibacter sp. TaxID=2053492 RepID=UPI0034223A15
MPPERRIVEQCPDRRREVAPPCQRVKDVLNRDEDEAVVVAVSPAGDERPVAGVRRDPVVDTAQKVVDAGGVNVIEGIEIIAGIVVAAAFGIGRRCQGTALLPQRAPGSDDQRRKVAGNDIARRADDVDLAQGIPIEHVGFQSRRGILEPAGNHVPQALTVLVAKGRRRNGLPRELPDHRKILPLPRKGQ